MFIEFQKDNLKNKVDELKEIINLNKNTIKNLLKIKVKTYKNFVKILEDIEYKLDIFFTPISHINSVKNSKLSQSVYKKSLPILSKYTSEFGQNLKIYNSLKEIKKLEYEKLNAQEQKVLDNYIKDFKLSGAELEDKVKNELKSIELKLSELSNNFSQNLLDDTNSYKLVIENEEDIKEIPKTDLLNAKIKDQGKIKYEFTLQTPSYISYMTYGNNRKLREKIYKAYVSRAKKNDDIINNILKLRHKKANILGFDNYASYSLSKKMAKDTKTVIDFLNKLLERSLKQSKKEIKELEKEAKLDGVKSLKSFDIAYYSNKLKEKKFKINEEEYREYFEQESVVKGLFKFLNKMFKIKFKKIKIPTWNKKVKTYELIEKNEIIGRLYLDLEARKDKNSGAWMHNWQASIKDSHNKKDLASAFIVCNFSPSNKKNPSLLIHDDVVTLFHEMGHALHHLLSKVNEYSINGINGVEWDAVEFPSQFLENFAYEKDVLKIFAKHYKAKKILKDDMIDKLKKSKNFQSGLAMLRQLEFAIFDFKLHTKPYKKNEVQNLLDEIRNETSLIKPPSYNKFQNGFSHIFSGGYAAGYYSYKWAEVLSADAFFHFLDNKIFNKKIANSYKKNVLYKGGSKSMQELFKNFIGRDFDTNSLLKLNEIT